MINNNETPSTVELLNLALGKILDGFSIWRAKRDLKGEILDFEMIYSNEISNNPKKMITAKLLHKPISEVIMNGDLERIRNVLINALKVYSPNLNMADGRSIDGWQDGISSKVLPLTRDEVLITYQNKGKNSTNEFRAQWIYEHDPLTGLIDQVLLEDLLNEALLNLQRTDEQFAFGMLDLDDFIRINNRYGRDFGDLVLRQFSETFQALLKKSDRLIRLGEDDFAVILRNVNDLSEITAISKELMQLSFNGWILDGELIKLAFSAGFVLVNDPFATTQEIFHLTETQMYKVKNHGKNGFVSSVFHGLVKQ